MFFQPASFGSQSLAAIGKWTKRWTADRRQISMPIASIIWLHV